MPEPTPKAFIGLEPPKRAVRPGVRGKTKRDIQCGENEVVKKGTDVIIQPLGDGSYKLTTFKKDNREGMGHLPEGQRDVIPDRSYKTSQIDDPKAAFKFSEHYQQTSSPLFADDDSPTLDEIKQGQIPDCFLLASIQSILQNPNGSEYIRSIMKQNDDGTTTVRLFNPITLAPEYVIVPNAVLVDERGKALNEHKALWIHVLESAYTAMQFKNDNAASLVEADASFSSVFSGGGLTTTADKILLGCQAELTIISPPPVPWKISKEQFEQLKALDPFNLEQFKSKLTEAKEILSIVSSIMPPKLKEAKVPEVQEPEYEALGEDESFNLYKEYFEFYKENKDAIDAIMSGDQTDAEKMFLIIDLVPEDNKNVSLFLNKTLNYEYVRTNDMTVRHEMEAFKGFYSENQKKIYNQVKVALEQGEIVGVGTGGIDMAIEGLVGTHAYSVFGVREVEVGSGINPITHQMEPITARFVQLKNPWGRYGRAYEQQGDGFKPVAIDEDIFELELSEFCKYVSHLDITQGAQQRFENERQKNEILRGRDLEESDEFSRLSLREQIELTRDIQVVRFEQLMFNELNPKMKEEFGKRISAYQKIAKVGYDGLENDSINTLAVIIKGKSTFNEARDYLTNDAAGQQLVRLFKLDYLENKTDKTEHDITRIKELKQEILEHSNNEVKRYIGIPVALSKQFEQKLKEFNALSERVATLAQSEEKGMELCDAYKDLLVNFRELDVMYQLVKESHPELMEPGLTSAQLKSEDEELTTSLAVWDSIWVENSEVIVALDPELEDDKQEVSDNESDSAASTPEFDGTDPRSYRDFFNKAQDSMVGHKNILAKIQAYSDYLAEKEAVILDLVHHAADYVNKGQLGSAEMADVKAFIENPDPELEDARNITQNSKMPALLKELVVTLYKLKNILSSLFSSIKNEITKNISLLRGHDYMLVSNKRFDKKVFGNDNKDFKRKYQEQCPSTSNKDELEKDNQQKDQTSHSRQVP